MNKIFYIALALFLTACATRKHTVSTTDTDQTVTATAATHTTATDSAFAVLSEVYDRDSMSLSWSFALVTDSTGRPLYGAKIINGSRSWARSSRQNTQKSASLSDTASVLAADTTTTTTKSARTETRTKRSQPPDVLVFILLIVAAAAALTIIKARKL